MTYNALIQNAMIEGPFTAKLIYDDSVIATNTIYTINPSKDKTANVVLSFKTTSPLNIKSPYIFSFIFSVSITNSTNTITINPILTAGTAIYSLSVVHTITVGSNPSYVVFNPAGTLAYVTNWGSGTVSVIIPNSKTSENTSTLIPVTSITLTTASTSILYTPNVVTNSYRNIAIIATIIVIVIISIIIFKLKKRKG